MYWKRGWEKRLGQLERLKNKINYESNGRS